MDSENTAMAEAGEMGSDNLSDGARSRERSPSYVPEGQAGPKGQVPEGHYTFAQYQADSATTATYPDRYGPLGLAYITAGLASEAGEVAGKIAKGLRDADGIFDEVRVREIEKELGDVLWFVAELCNHFNISLADVALLNVMKLRDRMSRGVLGGSGDNR